MNHAALVRALDAAGASVVYRVEALGCAAFAAFLGGNRIEWMVDGVIRGKLLAHLADETAKIRGFVTYYPPDSTDGILVGTIPIAVKRIRYGQPKTLADLIAEM